MLLAKAGLETVGGRATGYVIHGAGGILSRRNIHHGCNGGFPLLADFVENVGT
jgi:hypothetical protein